MKILIIDNNIMQDSWGADSLRALAASGGASVYVRRAPQEDLPKDILGYDRYIVSGSITSVNDDAPWIDKHDEALKKILDARKPLLGVCYGHQAISRILGGRKTTRRGTTPEFGWIEIERTEDSSKLLEGLPQKFRSFAWHYDEVIDPPPSLHVLARSGRCGVQAMEVRGQPAWGIQFHPEKSLEAGEKSIEEMIRKKTPMDAIFGRKLGKKLFDPKVPETIFRNFLST